MIDVNSIKNGMTLLIEGNIYQVVEFLHVKPGKGSAFMKMKLRNLRTGSLVEETYNTNIKVERARVDRLPMQYLYSMGDSYVFMNNETYEQIEIDASKLTEQIKYLKEGLEISITMYEGEILGVTLPEKIEYEVVETSEAVKGNTTNNALKDAEVETVEQATLDLEQTTEE